MATGGIALLTLSGFELDGDYYIMKLRNDELVDGVINTIEKRINPRSFLRSCPCLFTKHSTKKW